MIYPIYILYHNIQDNFTLRVHACMFVYTAPPGPPDCTHGEIQLVNGLNELEGRLELCNNGHWETVCNNWFQTPAATVACRQLGYEVSGLN